jgi:hypothetical protein
LCRDRIIFSILVLQQNIVIMNLKRDSVHLTQIYEEIIAILHVQARQEYEYSMPQ